MSRSFPFPLHRFHDRRHDAFQIRLLVCLGSTRFPFGLLRAPQQNRESAKTNMRCILGTCNDYNKNVGSGPAANKCAMNNEVSLGLCDVLAVKAFEAPRPAS